MVSRERALRAGVASTAILAAVGASQMVTAQSGERTIQLHNIHTKETVTAVYKRNGKFLEDGLEKVNHVLRDWRKNEATKMDPELVDLLWEIHHELGSKEPIHIISGYRSRATNEQLRKTVGGQASESRHIMGKAADVHFPDVPLKNLRYSALIRERGGVGYYPTSAIPFVHVDTDRVRAWPRLPRYELALLFPSGQTKHAPADGPPISKEDVRVAQAKYQELAVQVAAFHDDRRNGAKSAVTVAAANPPAAAFVPTAASDRAPVRQQVAALPQPATEPRLLEAPQVAPQPKPRPVAGTTPTAGERARLSELAALATTSAGPAPRLLVGPAPARRPAQPALASLTGGAPSVPGILQVTEPPPAPRVAALDTAAIPREAETLTDSGRFGWAGNWIPAPAFDEEHPEELSYRPFPIAPLLTSSPTEPLMAELVPHDVGRTLDMIAEGASVLPLRFRPGEQTARLLWAQQFTGEAVGLGKLQAEMGTPIPGMQKKAVRTTSN